MTHTTDTTAGQHMPPTPEKIRVYLAGPMTGLPALNFPTFHKAAAKLREHGLHVANPAEGDKPGTWADCMRLDIAELVQCHWIAMLPGWRASRGANLEHHIATSLGMPVLELPENFTTT